MGLWDFEEHIVGRGEGGLNNHMGGKPQRVGTFFMAGIVPRHTKKGFLFGNWRRARLDEMVKKCG